jgi:hypothetical protein
MISGNKTVNLEPPDPQAAGILRFAGHRAHSRLPAYRGSPVHTAVRSTVWLIRLFQQFLQRLYSAGDAQQSVSNIRLLELEFGCDSLPAVEFRAKLR